MASTIETKIDGAVLTISVTGKPDIVLDTDKLPADMQVHLRVHGAKQKAVDAAALSRDPKSGASATPDQKYHAVLEVVKQIERNEWNRRGQGDGSAGRGLLAEAMIRLTGRAPDDVETIIKAWDKATQTAMLSDPTIAPMVATIKAERAARKPAVANAPKVDTAALLAQLKGATPVAQAPKGDAAHTDKQVALNTARVAKEAAKKAK